MLDSSLSVEYNVTGAAVEFVVTLNKGRQWVGLGISPDGSMTNGEVGSDVVTCSKDEGAQRHVVADYDIPLGSGTNLENAECTDADGIVTMTFTRPLAASGNSGYLPISIELGVETTFIFAYGNGDKLAFHGGGYGDAISMLNPVPGRATHAPTPSPSKLNPAPTPSPSPALATPDSTIVFDSSIA